jgi:C4-dicarboxylate-specific signal transduction histidine kinase
LKCLTRDEPDLEAARQAASRTVKGATRAAQIIDRNRRLFKKSTSEHELVHVNELIGEMVAVVGSEAMRYGRGDRPELAADLPQVLGDRVQLHQVLLNLMMNSIEATKDVDGRAARDCRHVAAL